jgi:anti-sigma B factor antagonist
MTQLISVQVVKAPGHSEVRVAGEIDMLTAPRLRANLDTAMGHEPSRIIVDLTHVSFIDSSGLHVLIGTFHRVGPEAFGVVTRHPNVLRVFSISGIDAMIPVFESIEAATANLEAPATTSETTTSA